MKSFNTIVTTKTIKSDSGVMRLNPISEAIKNAIDAKATHIDICFEECESDGLFDNSISITIKDNGVGFSCFDDQYMQNRWTHYKGGDYIKNTLGGRSRGRYSYLKFVDFENECLSDIKIYTKYNNKSYSVIFQGENQNIGFSVKEEVVNHKENFTTKLYIKRLGNKFINGNTIEQMIEKTKKEIIVEFSDKLLK
ncbi:TPA: ATP-binding protein, partial [Campylobacter upsaliensis]|nr:ATP-binding protein [Campylobacter upsaliensis]